MTAPYFSAFPKVRYFGEVATNITLRAAFIDRLKQLSSIYYPYVIRDGETADIIASKYYGDSTYDWLVYLTNNIIDPYTQWPKDTITFQNYIIKKYGSEQEARSAIVFYRKNPEVNYMSISGTSFSDQPTAGFDRTTNYADITISVDSYANIADPADYYPVYAYDYEVELNEAKRNIVLIGDDYTNKVWLELKDLLNG